MKVCERFVTFAISVMAEVNKVTFRTDKGSQIHEDVQNCSRTGGAGIDSCLLSTVIGENNNLMAIASQEKLGEDASICVTQEGNTCDGKLPIQNGEVEQIQKCSDQSTVRLTANVCLQTSGNSVEISNSKVGNETGAMNKSSVIENVGSMPQLHFGKACTEKQVCGTNITVDTTKCTSNLQLNDQRTEQCTVSLDVTKTLPFASQENQQAGSLQVTCMASSTNSTTVAPCFSIPGNKIEMQQSGLLSKAEDSLTQHTTGCLPVASGSPTNSTCSITCMLTPSNPLASLVISQYQDKQITTAMSKTDAKDVTQTTISNSTTTCVPGSSTPLVTLHRFPVPFPEINDVQQDDPMFSSSSGNSQTVAQNPVTLSTPVTLNSSFVSAAINVAMKSVIPSTMPSVVLNNEDPKLNAVSSAMSTASTSIPTVCAKTPEEIHTSHPEATDSAPNVGPASTALTQNSTNPCTEATTSVSTPVSSNFVPEILTAFPNFTPCSKCNSILVCSCPGTSSIGAQGSSNVPSMTCSGSCQGVYTCNKMDVDVPDVKPQVFPVVPLNELDKLFDSLVEYDKVAKAEQPEAITTRLFPYQLQALNWMMTRENNTDLAPFWSHVNKSTWFNKGTKMSTDRKPHSPKGGILADDMGLGKTLTVITLIMANHLNGQPMFSRKASSHKRAASTSDQDEECKIEPSEKMPRKDSTDGYDNSDIIMDDKEAVKIVTIKKRKDAVDKKKRLADSKTLKQPGFKFRQMYLSKFSSKAKAIKTEKCKGKKEVAKPKTPPPINIDDDVLIGPWLSADSKGTKRNDNSRSLPDEDPVATLIVCPLSVLSNWTDQICSHVHRDVCLQVYMYYGPERLRDVKFLRQQDIVLTTYPTLTNDYNRNDSPLHKIKWLRVILDEGHTIRNPQTRLTKAMRDLVAQRRWVLTGTPIQNRLDDLWSVVKFLRLEPFDDKSWWNSALASSVRRGCQQAVNRLQKLLKHISIRRLKSDQDEGKPLVKLPPRTVVIQEVELSDEERQLYDAMQNHGQLIIGRYLRDGMVLKKYAHCFAILMRLRQLCLHPSLCAKESESLQHAQNLLQGIDDSDDDDLDADHDTQRLINDLLVTLSSGVDEECSVCLDSLVEPVITRCAHVFCQQCIMDVITSDTSAPNCPLCRAPVNENDLIKVPEKKKKKSTEAEKPNEESGKCKKSTKLETLMKALCAIRDKDPSTKSLVVSQFTSFLDIIEDALREQDIMFVRLDGRMTQEARASAINTFSDPSSSSPTVFLLSLTAGGVGLNLTAATRVFLLDPAWNPAVEEQCFDRSHRLGQTREVIITKYIVTNSVEERMLSLQEKKRELMGQAFGLETQSQEDRRRARVRDIRHLIGL